MKLMYKTSTNYPVIFVRSSESSNFSSYASCYCHVYEIFSLHFVTYILRKIFQMFESDFSYLSY